MNVMKKVLALFLIFTIGLTVMSLPVSAVEIKDHTHMASSPRAGYDALCPTCGKVGTWMYDTEVPSGYWYKTMAVYYCYNCEAVYHFYF